MLARCVLHLCLLVTFLSCAIPVTTPHAGHDAAWVSAQVAAVDLTPAERRWEDIRWVPDLDTALQLSRRYDRPIFLLTHFGNIDGRC